MLWSDACVVSWFDACAAPLKACCAVCRCVVLLDCAAVVVSTVGIYAVLLLLTSVFKALFEEMQMALGRKPKV